MNHKTVSFVVAVLYGLEERWRGIGPSDSFNELLRTDKVVSLDRAWQELGEKGFLGEFADEFSWDYRYGKVNGLQMAISTAVRDGIIRQDGTRFDYHLDELEIGEADNLACAARIPEALIRGARLELNRLLSSS